MQRMLPAGGKQSTVDHAAITLNSGQRGSSRDRGDADGIEMIKGLLWDS